MEKYSSMQFVVINHVPGHMLLINNLLWSTSIKKIRPHVSDNQLINRQLINYWLWSISIEKKPVMILICLKHNETFRIIFLIKIKIIIRQYYRGF